MAATKSANARAKVFGLGLSRTATTSLGAALNMLGIRTKDYPYDRATYRELTSGTYRLSVLEDYDAIVDITPAPFYPQLDHAYPRSKFILTTRDVERWLPAIEKHFAWLDSWEEMNPQFRRFTDFINACVYGSLRFDADRFRHVYQRHFGNVVEYFTGRPDDLLILDICGGEGWEKLCDFLALPVPDEPFPHVELRQIAADRAGVDSLRIERRSAEAIVPLIMELLSPRSVCDVGRGAGTWLGLFEGHGVGETLQIDPERMPAAGSFGLALSLEVAEQLPENASVGFVEALVGLAPAVLFSAAVPGQGGRGHVNEQWPTYWRRLFQRHDYRVIDCVRPRVWNNGEVKLAYRQSMLLFASHALIKSTPALRQERERSAGRPLSIVHPELLQAVIDKGDR